MAALDVYSYTLAPSIVIWKGDRPFVSRRVFPFLPAKIYSSDNRLQNRGIPMDMATQPVEPRELAILRQFRELVAPLEANITSPADERALQDALEPETRQEWSERLMTVHDDALASEKISKQVRMEALFEMDRYGLFKEQGFDSFLQMVQEKYQSSWAFSLKKAFTVRHRFGIHPGHPLYDTLEKIDSTQFLEVLNSLANEENLAPLIEKGARGELDVFTLREINKELKRGDFSQPVGEEEWIERIEEIEDVVRPIKLPGVDWEEIAEKVAKILRTNDANVTIQRRSGGDTVIVTFRRKRDK